MRKGIVALAVVFLAAHLPFLPPSLEDIDSINFALGVRDFDVARHRPHPPGYPVFIALAKMSTPLLRSAGVPAPEPRGLAVWSALSGAALVLLLFALFRALDDDARRAGLAAVVAAASPIFWFTALRPLSDMTGLAFAVAAQALLCAVIARRGGSRALLWGAFIAGLAIGVRSQTFLLTLPLLGLALVWPGTTLRLRDRAASIAAAGLGALAWVVPLILASGGLGGYMAALGTQAGEDFSGVVMLWTSRTPRVALDTLQYSLLWPWGGPIIGGVVVAIAIAGLARLAWRLPRALIVIAVAFVPYAVFHLLFHEVVTVRYALPLVVPVAWLVVLAFDGLPRAAAPAAVAALAIVSLAIAVPAAVKYGREQSPAMAALRAADVSGIGVAGAPNSVIAMHAVARRAAEWLGPELNRRLLKAPHGREWLTVVEQFRSNPSSTVWFVADPRRTDLALLDPSSRPVAPVRFRWGFVEPPFVGGARPGDSDLYQMPAPGWMLDRGWALTPEVAGVTSREKLGSHKAPSVAWIHTRPTDALMMIGGRHLGGATDPHASISLTLAGRPLSSFDVPPGFFFRLLPLPAGALDGPDGYRQLEVISRAADGSGREIAVGLEQFDLQSGAMPMVGLNDGWQEPEYNPLTAKSWRWMTERATMWVRPVGRDVTLILTGESPLRYYDAAPMVRISILGREVHRFGPTSDFTQDIVLPATELEAADGRVVIETSKWFVPGDRDGTADRRHLALRIYSWGVK